jgi:hypothetical protein
VSINNFSQNDSAIIAPFTRAVAITPSDTEDLAEITRGLNVHKGTGGSTTSINVLLIGDAEPVIMTFQVGFVIPLRIRRVYATGTDATVIVGLY